VREAREKLREQISGGAVQLDRLEACRTGPAGGIAEILDHPLPLSGGQWTVPGRQTLHEIPGEPEALFQGKKFMKSLRLAMLKGMWAESMAEGESGWGVLAKRPPWLSWSTASAPRPRMVPASRARLGRYSSQSALRLLTATAPSAETAALATTSMATPLFARPA